MHGLSHVYIENFRACRKLFLPLGDFTPLVGQNNVGKSTVLEALRMVLAPKGFSRNDANDPESPIIIAACIRGVSPDLIDLIPNPRHQAAIRPYCVDETLWIRVSASGTAKPRQEVWQPGQCDPDGLPLQWRSYPTGLPDAVSALLPEALHIRAMDDVQEDLGKGKAGSTIRGLLDEIMTPVLAAHVQLTDALNTVRSILSRDGVDRSPVLADFDESASNALADFFPGLGLDLDVPSIDVKEFFKSGDLNVTDHSSGDRRKFDQVGSGAQRAIQMALVRLLADLRHGRARGIARRLLLIDEPELFLHPQAVRNLREALRHLSEAGFQVVFSTHSPIMLCRENAPDTVIVRRHPEQGVFAKPPLRAAVLDAIDGAQAQSRVLFELGNIADIYFSDCVILCEGKTDKRLLPLIYERLYDQAPELDRRCFVSLGSCSSICKGAAVLGAMGIEYRVIADLDFAFTHARSGGWLAKEGEDLVEAKRILDRLKASDDVMLGSNGLPANASGQAAATVWSLFARDEEGQEVARLVHEDMKTHGAWVWPAGCIEDVLGVHEKGEEAILIQEDRIRALSAQAVAEQMVAFKDCLDWLKEA